MTKIINQNQTFQTFDLGLSAALISTGFELQDLDKFNPKKVQFNFLRTSDIDETVRDYFSDRLDINARTYFDNIKLLKNMIYLEKQ